MGKGGYEDSSPIHVEYTNIFVQEHGQRNVHKLAPSD